MSLKLRESLAERFKLVKIFGGCQRRLLQMWVDYVSFTDLSRTLSLKMCRFSVPRIFCLGMSNFPMDCTIKADFGMGLRRSQRKTKPETIWEERVLLLQLQIQKSPKNLPERKRKLRWNLSQLAPFPKALELDENRLLELPTYKPPLGLRYEHSKSLAAGISELSTFQRLLAHAIIDKIIEVMNSYAKNARETNQDEEDLDSVVRSWKPVNLTEIWWYIGCLLYMGYHKEVKHEEHWQNGHLKQYQSLKEFQQIYRYFTLRVKSF
jgi:Transposase IS4